jgi:hypothetical protein
VGAESHGQVGLQWLAIYRQQFILQRAKSVLHGRNRGHLLRCNIESIRLDFNPPSNTANGFSGTLAADLPAKSRYVGTVNYVMMRQDPMMRSITKPEAMKAVRSLIVANEVMGM